jgi:hypothetical protein
MTAAFAAYLAMRIHSLGGLGHPQGFHQLTAMQFMMSAVLAAHYFAALIWPPPLNFYHVFHATTALSAALVFALVALAGVAWAAW